MGGGSAGVVGGGQAGAANQAGGGQAGAAAEGGAAGAGGDGGQGGGAGSSGGADTCSSPAVTKYGACCNPQQPMHCKDGALAPSGPACDFTNGVCWCQNGGCACYVMSPLVPYTALAMRCPGW